MSSPKNDDEAKFNETLKRMLKAPPKPHKQPDDKKPKRPATSRRKASPSP